MKITYSSLIGILAVGTLQAQEVPPFTFTFGGGFTEPMRSTGRYTDLGWTIQGGAGYNFNSYLSALVDLAPQDSKRIEATAQAVFDEAAGQSNAFDQRSGRSLQKLGAKLVKWNAGGKHQAVVDHLGAQLQGICAKLPAGEPQHATCEGVFKPEPTKA